MILVHSHHPVKYNVSTDYHFPTIVQEVALYRASLRAAFIQHLHSPSPYTFMSVRQS